MDRHEGQEVFLPREVVFVRDVGDDRRFDEAAVCELAVGANVPAGEDGPVGFGLLGDLLVVLQRAIVDQRRDEGVALDRLADGEVLGLGDEFVGELVDDVLVDVDARGRRALLAAEGEGVVFDALDGAVDVSGVADDDRVLAAEFVEDTDILGIVLKGRRGVVSWKPSTTLRPSCSRRSAAFRAWWTFGHRSMSAYSSAMLSVAVRKLSLVPATVFWMASTPAPGRVSVTYSSVSIEAERPSITNAS